VLAGQADRLRGILAEADELAQRVAKRREASKVARGQLEPFSRPA
jgi:hypothetical protein